MDIRTEHNDGEDFGTLYLEPGPDDYYEVSGYGTPTIRIAFYNREARELIEAL